MKVFIKDANLLIDLYLGGLLDPWFDLGHETATTSLVLVEIKNPDQKEILNAKIADGRLRIEDIESDEWVLAAERAEEWKVSIPDASVTIVAQKLDSAVLLNGDGRLRKKSIEEGIDVRGTLWVIDHLIEEEAIECRTAISALELIIAGGTFLPQEECEKRLEKWGEDNVS